MTEKAKMFVAPPQEETKSLYVNIIGDVRSGKTSAAVAIKKAMERLGATVELRDGDTQDRISETRKRKIDEGRPLLREINVVIRTTQQRRGESCAHVMATGAHVMVTDTTQKGHYCGVCGVDL